MGLPFLTGRAKRKDHILSIDVGARTTKAVYLQRKGDRFSLQSFAVAESPCSDKPLSGDVLGDHLKEVTHSLGAFKGKQVTVAIGANDTLFRQIEMPLMPISDMRQMLKFNAKNYLQQDLPDYVFDCCYLLNNLHSKSQTGSKALSTSQKQKVVVGGVKSQYLDAIQSAIKAAGLTPDQVIPAMVCPINAFEVAEPETFAKEVVALVDIGFKNTSITILDCGEIILNRVVALGGDRLTHGLVESMGISYPEAENIKVGMTGEVQTNLETVINPLGRELRASIDFFEHQQDKTVSQVFISGGTAANEILLQILQTELMVPCTSWMPTRNLQLDLSPDKMGQVDQMAPQLTVALGAAASGF
jgi:type IV pilus assembly protein PilM